MGSQLSGTTNLTDGGQPGCICEGNSTGATVEASNQCQYALLWTTCILAFLCILAVHCSFAIKDMVRLRVEDRKLLRRRRAILRLEKSINRDLLQYEASIWTTEMETPVPTTTRETRHGRGQPTPMSSATFSDRDENPGNRGQVHNSLQNNPRPSTGTSAPLEDTPDQDQGFIAHGRDVSKALLPALPEYENEDADVMPGGPSSSTSGDQLSRGKSTKEDPSYGVTF